MDSKKRNKLINKVQEQLYEYWQDTSLNDIIHIKTKFIKTNYLQREAEDFLAIKLQARNVPGFPSDSTLRIIRLDKPSPIISMLPMDWVQSINNKEVNVKKVWQVKGSKGYYKVDRRGDNYYCNCQGFKFRKTCKHSALIREQNA